jgi:hypothetical protein
MGIKYLDDKGPDGTVLGQTSAALVGFWGKTPVDQPATIADATNTTTTTSTTTALTTDLDSVRTKLNAVIAALEEIGILANA